MTKRPLNLTFAGLVTYLVLIVSIMALITGLSYVIFSLFLFITEDGTVALNHFLIGLNLMGFGYLVNILFTSLLTGRWSWRFANSLTLRTASKK